MGLAKGVAHRVPHEIIACLMKEAARWRNRDFGFCPGKRTNGLVLLAEDRQSLCIERGGLFPDADEAR
jgi:hypothetical protein